MATQDYVERYNAGAICIECCAPIALGRPCGSCDAEDKMAHDLGFMSSDPKSPSYIPPVLRGTSRESLPEDLSEPPKLPENAGRYPAPDESGVTDNIRDLQHLREARAFPRPR